MFTTNEMDPPSAGLESKYQQNEALHCEALVFTKMSLHVNYSKSVFVVTSGKQPVFLRQCSVIPSYFKLIN